MRVSWNDVYEPSNMLKGRQPMEQYLTAHKRKEQDNTSEAHAGKEDTWDTNLFESQSSIGTPQDACVELWADPGSAQNLLELTQPNVINEDWVVRRSLWEQR